MWYICIYIIGMCDLVLVVLCWLMGWLMGFEELVDMGDDGGDIEVC